jgi:hypothetical protein
MSNLLEDMGNHLKECNIAGGDTGWTLFYSYQPDSPDKTVTILDTGGSEPDQTSGDRHTFPTFQLRVRGEMFGYQEARAKMRDAIFALDGAKIPGYVYIYPADSGVIPLRYDDGDNRPELVINFKSMKEPVLGSCDMTPHAGQLSFNTNINPIVAVPIQITAPSGGMSTLPSTPSPGSSENFSITIPSATMGASGN